MKKILLLLSASVQLSFSKSPAGHFYIVRKAKKEWQEIDRKALLLAIRNLYRSRLISAKEKSDGMIEMTISKQGKEKVLNYQIETMKLPKRPKWDNFWRMIIFDIPEKNKKGRDAFSRLLKKLGFYQLQKSVFIYPYDCESEMDFIIEFFNLRPFVRTLLVKNIDNELHLKRVFYLS